MHSSVMVHCFLFHKPFHPIANGFNIPPYGQNLMASKNSDRRNILDDKSSLTKESEYLGQNSERLFRKVI